MSKPWYKKWWAIVLFFLLGIFILGRLMGAEHKADDSFINEKKEDKDYSKDIGKTFCNATSNVCGGIITKIQPCTTDQTQQCYVVDMGKDYSRPAEHPVSNGYTK